MVPLSTRGTLGRSEYLFIKSARSLGEEGFPKMCLRGAPLPCHNPGIGFSGHIVNDNLFEFFVFHTIIIQHQPPYGCR